MARFIEVEGNPVPHGAKAIDIAGGDGVRIRAGVFPLNGAQGTFLVLTGWAEFMEKYFETIRDLQARGFACISMDWRGQGLSERFVRRGTTSHVEDFAQYRQDIDQLFLIAEENALPRPYFALTHSMGGTPMLQRLADDDIAIEAAILNAPLTRLAGGARQVVAARFGAAIACAVGAGRTGLPGWPDALAPFDETALTSDRARHDLFVRLQEAEPAAKVRRPTLGWLRAAIAAMDDLRRPGRLDRLAAPVLIVSAGIDRMVDSDDHASFADKSPRIDRKLIAEARHEILIERDELRSVFWGHVDEFLARAERSG
ncbi:MAG: alpha/beta hydrolase [Pseudomonadota bacterium]